MFMRKIFHNIGTSYNRKESIETFLYFLKKNIIYIFRKIYIRTSLGLKKHILYTSSRKNLHIYEHV